MTKPVVEGLFTIARKIGEDALAEDARALVQRAEEGRFYVACVGQFKRGKSTLLDALLGEPILPIGVIPVTTLPTLVRFGNERRARIRIAGADWSEIAPERIHEFASEAENPANRKSIDAIELMLPAPILRNGLCLVDTPGLGSVNDWNSEATRRFVPQVDVALLVTGADPPLTGEEMKLIESLFERTSRLLIVMNKADLSSASAIAEATDFARRVIRERTGRDAADFFITNAKAHLDGTQYSDDWDLLTERLTSLALESRDEIVNEGVRHGARRIANRLLWSVDEEMAMLGRPIEESKAHIEYLVALTADVERSIGDLRQILIGEQSRIVGVVEDDRRRFVAGASPRAAAELERAAKVSSLRGSALRRDLTRSAQEIAERHLNPWLASEEARIGELYAGGGLRFVELGRAFLNRLSPSAEAHREFPELLEELQALPKKTDYYYGRFESVAMNASPLRVIADAVRGLIGARRTIEAEVGQYLAKLLESNASRIEFDLRDRLDDARRRFERELVSLLRGVLSSARRNLHRARDAHARGLPAVEARLEELGVRKVEIVSMRDSVAPSRSRIAGAGAAR